MTTDCHCQVCIDHWFAHNTMDKYFICKHSFWLSHATLSWLKKTFGQNQCFFFPIFFVFFFEKKKRTTDYPQQDFSKTRHCSCLSLSVSGTSDSRAYAVTTKSCPFTARPANQFICSVMNSRLKYNKTSEWLFANVLFVKGIRFFTMAEGYGSLLEDGPGTTRSAGLQMQAN